MDIVIIRFLFKRPQSPLLVVNFAFIILAACVYIYIPWDT